MGLNAYEIHQKMSQADASSLGDAQRVSNSLWDQYSSLEQQVSELSSMIAAGWHGNAAQAAQAGTTPLSTMTTSAQNALAEHHNALIGQQGAVATVKSSVVPVDATPPQNSLLNEMTPWHTDLDKQIDNYNSGAHTNVAAYNTYVQSTSDNGSAIPSSFPGVAPDGSNVTVTAPDQGGSTSGGWGGTPYSGTGGGTTRTSSAGWSGSPGVGGGATGTSGWTSPPGAGGLRTDAAQWVNGPDAGRTGPSGPTAWGPNVGGPPGNSPTFGPVSSGFAGGQTEGGLGSRGGTGSARFGSGAGAGGTGGSGRGTPGAGNAVGAAEEQALGRAAAGRGMAGAAGARGAAGAPMGGTGGRGGKGEGDGEHRAASYLVGDRSDEFAGDLPLTAPPVIGE